MTPIDFEALAAPFAATEIEWRVGNKSKAGDKATLLCYLTSPVAAAKVADVLDLYLQDLDRRPISEAYGEGELTRCAFTADRVARWVAGRVGFEFGCTAPDWFRERDRQWLIGGDFDFDFTFGPAASRHLIPSLADINPTDDRRLTDGSRYTDRLALALVAQHLGGSA